MKRIVLLLSLIFSFEGLATAQNIPTGTWRTHLTYKNPEVCEATKNYVYAASAQGFWKTNDEGQMSKLLPKDGFAGLEVSHLRFHPSKNTLVIGYANGNIDLLISDKFIQNIPGFYNKLLQGDKRINHVSFYQNDALISTNFGLLIIDLNKYEIRDSYSSIGKNGAAVKVLASCVMGDSVYVGTTDGILAAKYSKSINLNDFNQWKYVVKGTNCKQLDFYKDSLFFDNDSVISVYTNGKSVPFKNSAKREVARIFSNENGLYLFSPGEWIHINSNGQQSNYINLVTTATEFKGNIWFSTGIGPGIIKRTSSGDIAFMPNGPDNASVFRMSKSGDQLVATAGGVSNTFGNAFNNNGFYVYNQEGWSNNMSSPFNQNMYDFTFVARRSRNNTYYAATHSNGVLIFSGKNIVGKLDETNSPLERQPGGNLWLAGIAEDSKGNLWFGNHKANKALHCLTPSNQWFSFNIGTGEIKDVAVDANDRKWIITSNGVMVFHEGKTLTDSSDNKIISLNSSHGLISTDVLSIQCDKNGYVWIGTLQGLNIFTGSYNLFTSPKLDRFIVEQDGSTGYLMGEETINDILIDGGNRKWFATNNGLFLVDEYGQKVIRHFNKENSPLLSNNLTCLGQIDPSGEIFIGTDKGIISYRNDANTASESFQEIIIYPNPVPPKFSGLITFEGLANNAEIRIADLQGKLVYQTQANGGKATWNGKRLDGTEPNSGVYLVFGINQDGTETAMGKFVFIK